MANEQTEMKLIEHEGAIFRGPSRGNPEEVLGANGWKPYSPARPPGVDWGDYVTPEEAERIAGRPIPN